MLGSWPTFRSPKGLLAPIELGQLPFVPKRVFYVCGVPKGQERGNHAHYTTKQILTCIQGEIIVKLHDGKELNIVTLKPTEWTFVDRWIWDSQTYITGQDVLMSICSTECNQTDYIKSFDTFIKITNGV